MMDLGFMTKYKLSIKVPKTRLPGFPNGTSIWSGPMNTPKIGMTGLPQARDRCWRIRAHSAGHGRGEKRHDRFSFWPDVIMIKEIGDPCVWPNTCSWTARSCKPGSSWPRGDRTPTTPSIFMPATRFSSRLFHHDQRENTAFIPIREYLNPGFPGYTGYQSTRRSSPTSLHFAQ
jgi:hypothetical protein